MKTNLKIYALTLAMLAGTACTPDGSSGDTSTQTSESTSGQGGSLAKFTLKGDYLYTVDYSGLNVYNIAEKTNPVKVNGVTIGFDIETLFSYQNYLYIGSRSGMYIYDISNPEFPTYLSDVQHFTACDPVVANDTHAYVTLHSNRFCGDEVNVLEIYDTADVEAPVLVATRELEQPKGLGLYGNYLFVCDDEIKIFDITEPTQSTFVKSIDKEAFDVIIHNDLLIAIAEEGVYQYALADTEAAGLSVTVLSELLF